MQSGGVYGGLLHAGDGGRDALSKQHSVLFVAKAGKGYARSLGKLLHAT